MALPNFTAGQRLRASDLNLVADQVDSNTTDITTLFAQEVGFASRITNGTTTTTAEKTYLRIDSIPILSGYSYLICTTPLIFESSVANDLVQVFIRLSTAGAATTASTAVTLLGQPSKSASLAQNTAGLSYRYASSTTGSLSILMSYLRAAGTGNVRINASADIPANIQVFRMGLSVSNTGVNL